MSRRWSGPASASAGRGRSARAAAGGGLGVGEGAGGRMDRSPGREPPGGGLDETRAPPEGTKQQREELRGHLVEGSPADRVIEAVRDRLGDLGGADASAVLRLVEA